LKGAERAFLKVTELEPQYADGWVNVGRARVLEGNTEAAKPVLEKALAINPRLASPRHSHWVRDGRKAHAAVRSKSRRPFYNGVGVVKGHVSFGCAT